MDITQLISTVGFPIVCVLGLAYYIYKKDQTDRADREETQQMLLDFSEAIKENTILTKSLICMVDKLLNGDENDENK